MSIKTLQKTLREDPDFNPLGITDIEDYPEWRELCDAILRDLDKVDVASKPPTEQELFKYQYQFYSEYGDPHATDRMFNIISSYAGSLILKVKKTSRYISKDILHDMAQEVALRVVSQYLKRPGFVIQGSFAGYIKWKIIEVTGEADDFERAVQIDPVTKKEKKMPLLSLNSLVDKAKGQETSIEDLQESLHFTNLGAPNQQGILTTETRIDQSVEGIMSIVRIATQFLHDKAQSNLQSFRDRLYIVLALHALFSGGMDNYHKLQQFAPNTKVLTLTEETVKEILELLRDLGERREDDV